MSRRKITIYSPGSNDSRDFMSSATKWGEIRNEVPEFRDGMKAIVQEGRIGLVSDDTELPVRDITIHITPGKIKSGRVVMAGPVSEIPFPDKAAVEGVVSRFKAMHSRFNEFAAKSAEENRILGERGLDGVRKALSA